jgi:uncharacterized membrane protein YkoI
MEREAEAIVRATAPETVIESELDFADGRPAHYVQVRQGTRDIRQVVVDARNGDVISNTINTNDDDEAP